MQEVAASQKTPTLAIVLPIYDELLATLEILMYKAPGLSIAIAASMLKLRYYVNRSRKSPAYILALGVSIDNRPVSFICAHLYSDST